jgi:hypothetical protein
MITTRTLKLGISLMGATGVLLLAGCQSTTDTSYIKKAGVVAPPVTPPGATPLKSIQNNYPLPKKPNLQEVPPSQEPPGSNLPRFASKSAPAKQSAVASSSTATPAVAAASPTTVVAAQTPATPATTAVAQTQAVGGAIAAAPVSASASASAPKQQLVQWVDSGLLIALPSDQAWSRVEHAIKAAHYTLLDQDAMMSSFYVQGVVSKQSPTHVPVYRWHLVSVDANTTRLEVLNEQNTLAGPAVAKSVLSGVVPYLK